MKSDTGTGLVDQLSRYEKIINCNHCPTGSEGATAQPSRRTACVQPMGSQVFSLPFGSQVVDSRPFSDNHQTDTTTFSEPTFETFLDSSSQQPMAARSKEGLNSSFPNTTK